MVAGAEGMDCCSGARAGTDPSEVARHPRGHGGAIARHQCGSRQPIFPHSIMTRRLPTKQLLRLGGLAIHVLKSVEKAVQGLDLRQRKLLRSSHEGGEQRPAGPRLAGGEILGFLNMDRHVERALELLREAGACFPDSFTALNGAKVLADALIQAKKEAPSEAEEHPLFQTPRIENQGRVSTQDQRAPQRKQ
jgi:hypothetical protein